MIDRDDDNHEPCIQPNHKVGNNRIIATICTIIIFPINYIPYDKPCKHKCLWNHIDNDMNFSAKTKDATEQNGKGKNAAANVGGYLKP